MNSANRFFTETAVFVISACESLFLEIPEAKFDISEMPTIFNPKL